MDFSRLIYILFELTMFGLLAIQLFLLIKQYLLPVLRRQIANFHQAWKDLQAKLTLTRKTKKHLKEKIQQQGEAFNSLEEKIKVWHAGLTAKHKKLVAQKMQVAHALEKKKAGQLAHLATTRAKEKVLPQAIKQAQETLKQKLAGGEGKKYLSNVLHQLGKAD